MIEAIPPVEEKSLDEAYCPSLKNPAVALCTEAWVKIHEATRKQTKCMHTAERSAGKAYRAAMPPLIGYQNICDFIACTGYGMLIGAIKERERQQVSLRRPGRPRGLRQAQNPDPFRRLTPTPNFCRNQQILKRLGQY